jgi:hypothetical protein
VIRPLVTLWARTLYVTGELLCMTADTLDRAARPR